MPHDNPLIALLVIGLGLAFVLGTVAHRLKVSPLVGYLLAGVMVGPFTPGFDADQALALQLAEVGVILLMFGVGLHFSIKDLLAVRAVALPAAILQMAISVLAGMGLGWLLGLSAGGGLALGLALSIASTVVLTRGFQERRMEDSEAGRIAVGWLVIQDLITVLVLVLLPILASLLQDGGSSHPPLSQLMLLIGETIAKVVAFIAIMLLVGRRVIPFLLHYVAHTGSRELFRLAVLAIALGVAFCAAHLFGVSFALGAFVAGMVMSESQLSLRAAEETLPLRDAFAVLFFISVGMLLDPEVLVHQPLQLIGLLLVILVVTPGVAFLLLRAMGRSWATSITIALGLAQIGEFSFILAALALGLHLFANNVRDLVLGASILSIIVNPLLFRLMKQFRPWIDRKDGVLPLPSDAAEPALALPRTDLADHAILVGYGRVGQRVAEGLRQSGWPLLVIETGEGTARALEQEGGVTIITGNAADPAVMEAANLAAARLVIVAIPNVFEAGQIVAQAKAANPTAIIIARAHFDQEVTHLAKLGAGIVVMGEEEIARTMLSYARETPGDAPILEGEAVEADEIAMDSHAKNDFVDPPG
ncbi:MAG TPA: YbaL family putative K(+) efflux transporter [Acidisoma sp.]|jgi:CPA2 family monovalent cation:H+ antiporter-2|uniref:YbaL family putative K(+) efflux transporter n=1 Tax=Acidisoma sp. TaxID=1872115 RepID=UPI002CE1C85E|nr:YbaL family putative K(+) efflux transporter [Acidisoma sp.]HTI02769.1 YbaL family putative K(+) efflux transporter [Acidisoma sp.]